MLQPILINNGEDSKLIQDSEWVNVDGALELPPEATLGYVPYSMKK